MTSEQKKKMLEGFQKVDPVEFDDSYWTEERKIESAKRIIERLGLNGKLQ